MTNIPTREELRMQVREMMKIHPSYRQCVNCSNYDPVTSLCLPKGVKVYPRVPACPQHCLAEERILSDAIERLYQDTGDIEDDAIEYLLSLGLTMINAGTLFLVDGEDRTRKMHKACKDKSEKRGLRKDLDMFAQLIPASKKMSESIEAIKDSYYAHKEAFVKEMEQRLAEMDAQYRHYFQSHLNRIFMKDGKFDGEKDAQFLSSSGTFCITILDKLKSVMQEANETFPFKDSDYKRYRIRQ